MSAEVAMRGLFSIQQRVHNQAMYISLYASTPLSLIEEPQSSHITRGMPDSTRVWAHMHA
jgi:hypothetical protein